MMKNIQEMKNIKDIYSKVLAKQNINEPQMNIPKPETYTPLWDEKDLPPPVLNLNSSFQLIQKSCGYILSHIGFDSATEQVLSTFSDIMMQLLYTAGRTMSAFIDKYGTIMQPEVSYLNTGNLVPCTFRIRSKRSNRSPNVYKP